jgi:hypothetical protein
MDIASIGSSLSEIAIQHHLHKQRQNRIRKSAIRPPDAILEPEPLPPIPPPPSPPLPTPRERYFSVFDIVMKLVCEQYDVTSSDILSQRRLGNIVKARHAAIVMLYRFTQWTTFKIALKLNRDPSTVFYVIQKHLKDRDNFSGLEEQIRDRLPLVHNIATSAAHP